MKNGEMYGMLQILNSLSGKARSFKLIGAINRNIARLTDAIKKLEEARKPSSRMQEYNTKRIDLCIRHAIKDENGNPKIRTTAGRSEYEIADMAAFKAELDPLYKEYESDIKADELLIQQFNKSLDEEADIEIYKIKYSVLEAEQKELPLDMRLTGSEIGLLWFMIDDDEK